MISLRLDNKVERKLKRVAKAKGLSQSEYLRSILVDRLDQEAIDETPWSLGQDCFGKYGSGRGDLSTNRKYLLKEKLRAKKSRN